MTKKLSLSLTGDVIKLKSAPEVVSFVIHKQPSEGVCIKARYVFLTHLHRKIFFMKKLQVLWSEFLFNKILK